MPIYFPTQLRTAPAPLSAWRTIRDAIRRPSIAFLLPTLGLALVAVEQRCHSSDSLILVIPFSQIYSILSLRALQVNSVSLRAMEQTARPGRATTLFQTSIYLA